MLFLALELEWCRAWAHPHRWQEECLLLNKEMCWVLAFFKWQVSDWRQKAHQLEHELLTSTIQNPVLVKADIDSRQPTREGKIAYAYRQASIHNQMIMQCGRICHTNCFTWRLPMPISESNFIDNLMYLLDVDIDMFEKHYYAMILGLSIGIYNAR